MQKLVLLCVAVLAFFGGLLLERWSGREPARAVAPEERLSAQEGSGETLAQLMAEVVRMRQALERFAEAAALREPVTDAAGGARADDAALRELVEELGLALRAVEGRSGRGPAAPASALRLPAPDYRPRPVPRVIDLEQGGNLREMNRQHILWSCQDVLDAYGLPDEIQAGGGEGFIWNYQGSDYKTCFHFVDGLVMSVWDG
jgi:hypothetical protein